MVHARKYGRSVVQNQTILLGERKNPRVSVKIARSMRWLKTDSPSSYQYPTFQRHMIIIAPTRRKSGGVGPFVASKTSAHTYNPTKTSKKVMMGPFADGGPPCDDRDFRTLPVLASSAHCEHVLPTIIFPPHLGQKTTRTTMQ